MTDFIDGDLRRIGMDTIEIAKAKNTKDSEEVLKRVLRRIAIEYNGHVRAEIIRPISIFDGGLRARLVINQGYIQHVFDTQANKNPLLSTSETEPLLNLSPELSRFS